MQLGDSAETVEVVDGFETPGVKQVEQLQTSFVFKLHGFLDFSRGGGTM